MSLLRSEEIGKCWLWQIGVLIAVSLPLHSSRFSIPFKRHVLNISLNDWYCPAFIERVHDLDDRILQCSRSPVGNLLINLIAIKRKKLRATPRSELVALPPSTKRPDRAGCYQTSLACVIGAAIFQPYNSRCSAAMCLTWPISSRQLSSGSRVYVRRVTYFRVSSYESGSCLIAIGRIRLPYE